MTTAARTTAAEPRHNRRELNRETFQGGDENMSTEPNGQSADVTDDTTRRIEQLEAMVRQLTGREPEPSDDPRDRADYVEHGSDQHAGLLGLRKAAKSEKPQVEGWTFEDITQFGPTASVEYLAISLRQKVAELTTPIPKTQSVDPRKAGFAPTMWDPRRGQPLSSITE